MGQEESGVTNSGPQRLISKVPTMTSAERADCASLPRGSLLYVQTMNRRYWIPCLAGTAVRIAGHPEYCPTPAAGHVLESGLLERGKRFRFLLQDCRSVTTSRVVRVRVQQSKYSSAIHWRLSRIRATLVLRAKTAHRSVNQSSLWNEVRKRHSWPVSVAFPESGPLQSGSTLAQWSVTPHTKI
jgi:hypothetical protein